MRVRAGATGTGDGSSWENAVPSLAQAVSACSVTTATGVGSGVSTGAEVPWTAIVTVPAR